MKTLDNIKSEIAALEKQWAISDGEKMLIKPSVIRKAEKHLLFLRQCRMAVERGAHEESLRLQLEALLRQEQAVYDGFTHWQNRPDRNNTGNKTLKELEIQYHNEMRLPDIKNQIKTINYLLT